MADYTWRDETTKRRIYVLPSPTNLTELSKAMSAIDNDLAARGIKHWDDTVTVEAHDDEIHLSFGINPELAPPSRARVPMDLGDDPDGDLDGYDGAL